MIELKYVFSTPAVQWRHPIPRDRAIALSPTHTTALAIPGERTGVAAKLGERRSLKVSLPKTASNHYILCWITVERSILDKASDECPSRHFRPFSAVLLNYYYCTHMVGSWVVGGYAFLLYCGTMVRASWVTGRYLLFCCCYYTTAVVLLII